jgi:hypothetical protein
MKTARVITSMKRLPLILPIILLLVTTLAATSQCKTVVFFIGGWRMTPEQMELFSSSVPESRKVKFLLPDAMSELVRPWHCADLVHNYIKKNNLSGADLIFVTFSLGGTVA